jgi:hypothetical protein
MASALVMNTQEETDTKVKKDNPWIQFQKRVRAQTGFTPAVTMQYCAYLKQIAKDSDKYKSYADLTDEDIKASAPIWLEKEEKEKKKSSTENAGDPSPPQQTEKVAEPEKKVAGKKKTTKDVAGDPSPSPSPQPVIIPEKATAAKKNAEVVAPTVKSLEYEITALEKAAATAAAAYEKDEKDAKIATSRAVAARAEADECQKKADVAVAAASEKKSALKEANAMVQKKKKELATAVATEAAAAAAAVAAAPPVVIPQAAEPTEDLSGPICVRRKNIPKHIKTLVWNKYIGVDIAQADCVCCRSQKINVRSFHCGHVIAESRGGDLTINNLRPICAECNGAMTTKSMNEFTKEFFGWSI